MKKSISVIASSVILGGLLAGCGNSSNGSTSSTSSSSSSSSSSSTTSGGIDPTVSSSSGGVVIRTPTGGVTVGVTGGTVVTRSNSDGTDEVASVVHSELNECTDATTLGSRVACGPKAGVTYVFQSDFAKLGPVDNDPNTPDGGVLLYDAQTAYNGTLHPTPNEGDPDAQRIEAVYIPTNYIVLDDQVAGDNSTVNEKYDYMREYLDDVFNMKCMFQEYDNNVSSEAFFDENKTEGRFVATYVMQFTRGIAASTLDGEFESGNVDNLEYLAVSFEIDVRKNSANLFRFTTPAGTPISFYGKKHGENAVQVDSTNVVINSIEHAADLDDADDVIAVNMARYFDKLIAKGDSIAISDYAKEILVENALNPWPVKIYGTLHEITSSVNDPIVAARSFVRNPAKLDASLFNLNVTGPYMNAFNSDQDEKANAQKFILVYPGGVYNQL